MKRPTTLSHTPPRCGLEGGIKCHSIPNLRSSGCEASFSFLISDFRIEAAALMFDPLSEAKYFTPGLRPKKRWIAFRSDDASSVNTTSAWTALDAKHTKMHIQILWSDLPPRFTRNGPIKSRPVRSNTASSFTRSSGRGPIFCSTGFLWAFLQSRHVETTFLTKFMPLIR